MLQRSKKAAVPQHKQVTLGFLLIIAISILYVVFVPKTNTNDILIIDDT